MHFISISVQCDQLRSRAKELELRLIPGWLYCGRYIGVLWTEIRMGKVWESMEVTMGKTIYGGMKYCYQGARYTYHLCNDHLTTH